ncbi:MAG: hypothetical protein JW909_01570 [Planctomycetes bacterium]|nr:hypothetical protein [Planctomycetota bacterium]
MPGGIWGLLSPRLELWAEADRIAAYGAAGESSEVAVAGAYRRGGIVDPRKLARALVAAYREHSHRSYWVSPVVRAYVPPGTSPAGLFVWDAVLRTSGASDWVIEDIGPICLNIAGRPETAEVRTEALLFLLETYSAWEVIRCKGSNRQVIACGGIGVGTSDGLGTEGFAAVLGQSMRQTVREASEKMTEDDMALVASSTVLLFETELDSGESLRTAAVDAYRKAIGGGGEFQRIRMPGPETLRLHREQPPHRQRRSNSPKQPPV